MKNIRLAYSIGVAELVTVDVETFGIAQIDEEKIIGLVKKNFDLTPGGIINRLHLCRPIYKHTARYGHFGIKGPGYTWEMTDKIDILKKVLPIF